jgi:hypothetical protein
MERREFLQSTALSVAATILVVAPPAAAATHVFLSAGECHVRPNPPL